MRRALRLLLTASAATTLAAPLYAEPLAWSCPDAECKVRLTGEQVLAHASMLVQDRRFDEARPIVDALSMAPNMAMETHFLAGYMAVETGDIDTAIKRFRASLAVDPKQTRVRLELARAHDA